jgi:serine protease Do
VLAEKVNPAVVNILTKTNVPTRVGGPLGLITIRTPFLDLTAQALGSGFIVNPDGFLLTNAHVVSRAVDINILLWKTSQVKKATLVGIDRASDLALLKIDADAPLPYLPLADPGSVQIGGIVAAIGNPYGLKHSLTSGLISAKHRRITPDADDDSAGFLQTSALINPGNSGGPPVNLKGEIVGVNTAGIANSQGIGFAVPSEVIRDVVPQLMRSGRVEKR